MKEQILFLVLFLILLVTLLAGCTSEPGVLKEEKSELVQEQGQETRGEIMGRVLFVIAQTGYQDDELGKPKAILEDAGYECDVASITRSVARGALGGSVKPDLAVKEVSVDDYDLVVVVGGPGSPELASHEEVMSLLRAAKEKNKVIGAICLGPMILAKAGVLEGRKATVFKTSESLSALESGGAVLVDQSVVVDGRVVTANGPGAAEGFGNELVKLLRG